MLRSLINKSHIVKNNIFINKYNFSNTKSSNKSNTTNSTSTIKKDVFGFMSIRKFKVLSPENLKHVIDLCGKEFAPMISAHPDFLAYYTSLSAKNDEYTSVSIFRTREGADHSLKVAHDFNGKYLSNHLQLLDHSEGETVVHTDSWSVFHGSHSS